MMFEISILWWISNYFKLLNQLVQRDFFVFNHFQFLTFPACKINKFIFNFLHLQTWSFFLSSTPFIHQIIFIVGLLFEENTFFAKKSVSLSKFIYSICNTTWNGAVRSAVVNGLVLHVCERQSVLFCRKLTFVISLAGSGFTIVKKIFFLN